MGEKQRILEKFGAPALSEFEKQNGDENCGERAQQNKSQIVEQRISRNDERIVGDKQKTEVSQTAPAAFPNSFGKLIVLKRDEKTEQRYIVIDEQIEHARQRDQKKRQRAAAHARVFGT